MQITTREKFKQHKDDMQKKYNVSDQSSFNVDPEHMSNELNLIRQTDEFLNRINLVLVPMQSGEAVGLASGKLLASRVDTIQYSRSPRKIKPESVMPYFCEQVNFDTSLSFGTVDEMAFYDNFSERFERTIRKHGNLDLIRIGFFGEKVADNSNVDLYPNGEDIAKGWLQALRDHRPESILSSDTNIKIGSGGTYDTVNEAVTAVKNKIAPRHRDVNDLIVLIGSDLVAHDNASFYQRQIDPNQPVNQIALRQLKESYGAMPAFMPSCFPARGIMVTSFDNLSIYFLADSLRRSFGTVNDAKDCIDNFESVSLDYVVEQLDKAAAIDFEAVQLKQGGTWV